MKFLAAGIGSRSLLVLLLLLAIENCSAAAMVDKRVTVQPILICDDNGQNCPAYIPSLFENAADKIWSQAGIDVQFLPLLEFDSSMFQIIEDANKAKDLFAGTNHQQNPDTNVVNLWITKQIVGAFGRGLNGQNGVVIDDDVFTTNGGQGRIDTISHEIGHNFGLDHFAYGAGGPENLMTADGRLIPQNLCDIVPTGLETDQLNDVQQAIARGSRFAQPIPAFERAVPPAALNIAGGALFVASDASVCYQLQWTSTITTNITWSDVGNLQPGTGDILTWQVLTQGAQGYFRLELKP